MKSEVSLTRVLATLVVLTWVGLNSITEWPSQTVLAQKRAGQPGAPQLTWQELARPATASPAAPEQQLTELKIDDGSGETGFLQDGLIMLNRLTPVSYPVKLEKLVFSFVRFQNQPDPAGQPITVLILVDPSGSGTLPANPQFTRLNTTVPGTSTTSLFELTIGNGPTITSGDLYVGYQTGTPHNGVGFFVDNNSTHQSRTYFSTNGGGVFNRLAPGGGAAAANAIIRAVVSSQQPLALTSGVAVTGSLAAPAGPGVGVPTVPQYVITVPANAAQLKLDVNGSQDMDLFARYEQPVTVTANGQFFTDHSASSASNSETITITPASNPPLRAGRYFIQAANYGPGAANFTLTATVTAGQQGPVLSSITPASGRVGARGTITLRGERFVAVPKVLLNGRELYTPIFVSATELRATIVADHTPSAGNASIKVVNPDGSESNIVAFPVEALAAEAESEPNHTQFGADLLPLPGRRTGRAAFNDPFDLRKDYGNGDLDPLEDLYSFYLPQASQVEIILTSTATPNEADFDLFLFRETPLAEGRRLEEVDASNHIAADNGFATERIATGLQPGRYLVAVSAYSGAANYTLTAAVPALAILSSADYTRFVAADFIATIFGAKVATQGASNPPGTLPTSLGGTTVRLRDSAGRDTLLPLFFVSPNQLNCWIPPNVAYGLATLTITAGDGTVTTGTTVIYDYAPSIFTANGSGSGMPAGIAFRLRANGTQSVEQIFRFDAAGRLVPIPIDLGPDGDRVFLVMFGTGFRNAKKLNDAKLQIGGIDTLIAYIGPQGDLTGLDQLNLGPLPRSLAGRGEVEVKFVDDFFNDANVVKINVR